MDAILTRSTTKITEEVKKGSKHRELGEACVALQGEKTTTLRTSPLGPTLRSSRRTPSQVRPPPSRARGATSP